MAPIEFKQAADALGLADASFARHDDVAHVNQLAYLAGQRLALAEQVGLRKASEAQIAEAGAAQQDAQTSQQQAGEAQRRNDVLEAHMRELNARKTDRGMVVTIGDLLFDTDHAQLKPGGQRSIERRGAFL